MDITPYLQFSRSMIAWADESEISSTDLIALLDVLSTSQNDNSWALVNKLMSWCREREIDIDVLPSLTAQLKTATEAAQHTPAQTSLFPTGKSGAPDLKALREARNLSANEAAKQIGIAHSTLRDAEEGRREIRSQPKMKIEAFYNIKIP